MEQEKQTLSDALRDEQQKSAALGGDRESLLQTVQALQEQLQLSENSRSEASDQIKLCNPIEHLSASVRELEER